MKNKSNFYDIINNRKKI